MDRLSYALWLMLFLALPISVLWFFFYKRLIRYTKVFIINILLVLLGLIWDIWGVNAGVWSFPSGHNLGYYFLGLPLEEYLAFIFFAIFVTSLTIILRFHGHLKIIHPE